METEDLLDVVRQRVGQACQEVGGEAPTYGDTMLLRIIKTINFSLITLGVVTGITVDTKTNQITPNSFSIPIGMLLASGASASLIRDDIVSRLRRGELGLAFSTGGTAITTNQAAISLQIEAKRLDAWHQLLFTAYLSGDPNNVIQRADSVGFNVFGTT